MNSYKNILLAGVVFVIAVFILTGAAFGVVFAYIMADDGNLPFTEQVAITDIFTPQPVLSTARPEEQLPDVVGKSDTINAVEIALPAVVTVLNRGRQGSGSGSGFFVSAEGYIVTNNHVIEGASELIIVYAQGGTARAKLVGSTTEFDLAVLKVDGPVPGVIAWGNSSKIPLGADVIAIGSALGQYQNSVTAGILSGFNRELGGIRGLLQTDAAINHGNSGGPLINLAGQVIGINTMVLRGGRSEAEGLGFAIPSNIARSAVNHLIDTGEVRAPFLGVQYQELNPQLASKEGLAITDGALLQNIVPNTPADKASLQVGDVILSIDGQVLDDRNSLVSVLLEHVAGDVVTLKVLRNGSTFQTTLTLGKRA